MFFLDQITDIKLKTKTKEYKSIDFSDTSQLYSISTSSYLAGFIWLIESSSYGLFKVEPKDVTGLKIQDMRSAIEKDHQGKEQKVWKAIIHYVKNLGVKQKKEIPFLSVKDEKYNSSFISKPSLNPEFLLKNASWLQYLTLLVVSVFLFSLIYICLQESVIIFTYILSTLRTRYIFFFRLIFL